MPDTPTACVLCWPSQGNILVFDGAHAHGVLESANMEDVRMTLLVNWWLEQPLVCIRAVTSRAGRPVQLPDASIDILQNHGPCLASHMLPEPLPRASLSKHNTTQHTHSAQAALTWMLQLAARCVCAPSRSQRLRHAAPLLCREETWTRIMSSILPRHWQRLLERLPVLMGCLSLPLVASEPRGHLGVCRTYRRWRKQRGRQQKPWQGYRQRT